jgi:hypothetical protein
VQLARCAVAGGEPVPQRLERGHNVVPIARQHERPRWAHERSQRETGPVVDGGQKWRGTWRWRRRAKRSREAEQQVMLGLVRLESWADGA